MRKLVWLLVALLFIAHQDFWWWDDRTLVMGFIPLGLFYHVCFSIASGAVWLLALKFAWPSTVEDWALEDKAQSSEAGS